MKKYMIMAPLVLAMSLTAGCAGMTNQEQGRMVGATLGAVAGHHLSKGHTDRGWAIGLGALFGMAMGSSIGKDLDERDKQLMNNNFQNTLEYSRSGNRTGWSNPDSGHSGTTVARSATRSTTVGYEYCREFTTTVNVAGSVQQGYGTACRKPDGSWEITPYR